MAAFYIRFQYICVAVMITIAGHAQQSAFVPSRLGDGINTEYDEINPVMSPDNRTLYFVRVNHPENTYGASDSQDIWMSTRKPDGAWSPAVRVSELNIGRYNAILSLSADGTTALLNGIYNKKGNIWKKRGLSVATKMGEVWSTPQRLRVKKLSKRNRGMKSSAVMSADGQLIFMSFSRWYNSEKSNLFVSELKRNGKWRRPIPLRKLNTRYNEEAPFLAPDGKTLYFASDRKERGQFNIYKTVLGVKDIDSWTKPELLSDTINTNGWESYFKFDARGTWAYFSSTRTGAQGADIYQVKMVEDNPFVVVSGTVRNARSKRVLIGKPITILADGKPAMARVSMDSGRYEVKLPLGKKYVLMPSAKHYMGIADTIDVRGKREFMKVSRDLKANPLPYVLVQGKISEEGTTRAIPAKDKPYVTVNGQLSDSLGNGSGVYAIKLNWGEAYQLQVVADRHTPRPLTIDLREKDEYEVISLDLTATAEKMAVVRGRILNKKNNQPMTGQSGLSIRVAGMDDVLAEVDATSGTYELKLPLGKSYVIRAGAPDFFPIEEQVDAGGQGQGQDVIISRDLLLVPIEVGQSVRLNNIFFEVGKAVLKSESYAELNRVVEFLQGSQDIIIEIAGHTDNVGKAATNLKLSEARAKAVAAYVVSQGVAQRRIRAKGYGAAKPVAPNTTKEGKARNRRVEFTILDK